MWNLSFSLSSSSFLLLSLLCVVPLCHAKDLDLSMPEQVSLIRTGSLTLTDALSQIEQANPSLLEMKARAEAMAHIPSQVASLPDPILSFSTLNLPVDTFNINQEAMTQLQFGISQQIPYPGKLALKESIALHLANAANSNVDEIKLHLNRDVKTLWWRLFFLDRSLDVININKTLLKQFIEIAQTKYKVGQGLQQDVLLAQLELSQLLDRNIQLNGTRKQQSARLNALLNQATDNHIVLPELSEIDIILPQLQTATSIFQIAKENRPALAQQRLFIKAANDRQKLAERNLLPDFNVGATYGFRGGNNPNGSNRADFLSLKVGINMPLFADTKQKKAISQRQSEVKQQQYALQDQWLNIQADITSTIADYDRAREQVLLFNTGIIPQARQTVASMLAGYQVNKVDFLNLIRAQITLYNYETNQWRTVSEAKSALAELIATAGVENIYE